MFQDFERTIRLSADPETVLAAILDVKRVASWLSIVRDVREVDPPRRYTALLEDRIGPFAMRADLRVDVEHGDRQLRVIASGEDRQVGSRIGARIELAVAPADGATDLTVTGRYEVVGRVATLGAGAIRKKGDQILDEFFTSAARELGGTR
jgi:uncharacterized protein